MPRRATTALLAAALAPGVEPFVVPNKRRRPPLRLNAGPAELWPSGYSWFGFRNPRGFSVPFSRLVENYENLLIFLIFHQFALASQPACGHSHVFGNMHLVAGAGVAALKMIIRMR